MIPEIILITKSLTCRLQEFEDLLSEVETPCSDIDEVWASIFQDLMLPKCGWQALWLMSEKSCVEYGVLHPTAVIVTVDSYWDEMTAIVSVKGVQGDIVLPSSMDVPVIELHPIKNQEYDEDDLKVIANWLDMCRYFFKYLWYPWDEKEKVRISDWCSSHLKNRLQLQCDIQNGVLNKKVASYYKSLVNESNQVHEALTKFDADDGSPRKSIEDLKNCFRRKTLKLELDLLECPEIRNDLMLMRFGKDWDKDHKKEAKFVWEGGCIDTLLSHLNSIKLQIDNDIVVKVVPTLQKALDDFSGGDSIILPPGSHVLNSFSGLESDGIIKGLGSVEETVMVDDFSSARRAILFICSGDLEFQNLTISRKEGIAVQIFEKTLKISNCRLTIEKSASSRGVIVLPGCTLIMENCDIVGFEVGIVLKKGSKAFISNTRIRHSYIGMKVSEDASLSLKDVEISDSSRVAVGLEVTGNRPDTPKFGDMDLLSDFCGDKFSFESVELKNNKWNAMIADSFDPYESEADCTHGTITLTDDSLEICSPEADRSS